MKAILQRIKRAFERKPVTELSKFEAARSPEVILKQSRHLIWAYRNGYRPVPGYTIAEKREDGTLYLAIEMEKI